MKKKIEEEEQVLNRVRFKQPHINVLTLAVLYVVVLIFGSVIMILAGVNTCGGSNIFQAIGCMEWWGWFGVVPVAGVLLNFVLLIGLGWYNLIRGR